ncbi:hypothetical protein ACDX78_03440 [Virgibacillus oceani]
MTDNYKAFIGSWLDALGTIISALAEVRALSGLNDINNQLISIGEALQALGSAIIGTVSSTESLGFAGNWINGAGAAASSLAAYLQDIENGEENEQLEILGDTMQSLGSSISAVSDYQQGEEEMAIGNALQGLGAGLESIGGIMVLRGEGAGQIISTIGAISQMIGSNYNALIITEELYQQNN